MQVVKEIKPGSTFGAVVESMMKMVLSTHEPCYVTMAGLVIVVFPDVQQIEVVPSLSEILRKGGLNN